VNGMVLAADGKKMSKRLRNYTPPDELIETFGADALRLFLINSGLVKAEELRFTDEGVKDMVRRALLPWFNSFKFFSTYAKVDGWKVDAKAGHEIAVDADGSFAFAGSNTDNILDQWLLSKMQTLIKNVNHEMQNYRLYNVVPELFNFIEDLTNWYIRLNRRRFWEEGMSADKNAAYCTLYTALETISRLMAPFSPFLADHIYQELKAFGGRTEESVHLCAYPESQEEMINATLETAVNRMQQVVLLGRQKRIQEGVKVKTPLKTLKVIHQDKVLLEEMSKLEEFIKIELNVKTVEYMSNESDFVTLSAKPNLPVLGKKLGKEMGAYKALIEKLSSADVQKVEDGGKVILNGIDFDATEILVLRNPKTGTQAVTNRFITIDLNCTLDRDLIDEGLAREMVNRIQKSRKDLGFNVADRIEVTVSTSEALGKVFEKYQSYISAETLMLKGSVSATQVQGGISHDIDEEKFDILVKRI
jgi:isoleucyl-tRNA synthetase